MSLLDDLRAILATDLVDSGAHAEYHPECIMCGAERLELPSTVYGYPGHSAQPHADDCPGRNIPRILAVLDAALRGEEVTA